MQMQVLYKQNILKSFKDLVEFIKKNTIKVIKVGRWANFILLKILNRTFSTFSIICGLLMEKVYCMQPWSEIHSLIHQESTNFYLNKCFFTTQLLDFRIKTSQLNSKGVKCCPCYFNFGSANTVDWSNNNFLSSYSKNWKSSAKWDDFTVPEFIMTFPSIRNIINKQQNIHG